MKVYVVILLLLLYASYSAAGVAQTQGLFDTQSCFTAEASGIFDASKECRTGFSRHCCADASPSQYRCFSQSKAVRCTRHPRAMCCNPNAQANTATSYPTAAGSMPTATRRTPATGSSTFQAALDTLNAQRAQHSAAPLTLSSSLTRFAQNWANRKKYMHSNGPYGENIAIGNGRGWESAANAAVTSVNLWYAKEAIYDFSNPGFAKATSQPWSGLQQQKSVLEQLKCLMANGS